MRKKFLTVFCMSVSTPACCTLSFIRLYLDKLGSKCNQAASRLFVKELALL